MNYRHAFHAGNHADVFKHLTLTRLIALMSRKEQPFAYLDTHAGIGLYDLQGDQANRTGEYLEGIARLWGERSAAADRRLHEGAARDEPGRAVALLPGLAGVGAAPDPFAGPCAAQ